MDAVDIDVLIVGGGSSGGVLATRLSDDPAVSVALVEAGRDFPNEATEPPSFYVGGQFFGEFATGIGAPVPELDWGMWSAPMSNGRRIRQFRGKLLGGSSMINGCVAVRGRPRDFEAWATAAGDATWSWAGVEPYYEKLRESVPIQSYPRRRWLPFQAAFFDGFRELGYREITDANEPDAWDGVVGPCPQNRLDEVRLGTLITHLRRARGRANLRLITDTLVQHVLFEGTKAVGVRCVRADGSFEDIRASVVVLSAGVYGSPSILLRSGVGPADDLAELGLETRADLPVGHGLMDHPAAPVRVQVPSEIAQLGSPQFAVFARGADWWSYPMSASESQGLCTLGVSLTECIPVGTVRLASTDPFALPIVDHRFDDVADANGFDGPWEENRRLAKTAAFLDIGAVVDDTPSSPEVVREKVASAQHPVGGCALGTVVDPHLQVFGAENLFVADASIFPKHVSNNPNLTCLMVGEKSADLILERVRAR